MSGCYEFFANGISNSKMTWVHTRGMSEETRHNAIWQQSIESKCCCWKNVVYFLHNSTITNGISRTNSDSILPLALLSPIGGDDKNHLSHICNCFSVPDISPLCLAGLLLQFSKIMPALFADKLAGIGFLSSNLPRPCCKE